MCCKYFLPIFVLLAPLVAGALPEQRYGRPATGTATDGPTIVEFTRAVHAYANLHHTVAAGLPPEEMCADPEEIQRRVGRLAQALRTERAEARAGDVFKPAIASLVRRRLADAVRQPLHRGDGLTLHQAPQDIPRLEVNDAFPWTAGHHMPPAILASLTPLPPELEYRFVYRDLVLLDVDANLVVDILEDALPLTSIGHETVEPRPERLGPCDVHPDLPMCWS